MDCVYCAINIIQANFIFDWFRSPRKMMPNAYYKRNCNTAGSRSVPVKYSSIKIVFEKFSASWWCVFLQCNVLCQSDFFTVVFYYNIRTNIMSSY